MTDQATHQRTQITANPEADPIAFATQWLDKARQIAGVMTEIISTDNPASHAAKSHAIDAYAQCYSIVLLAGAVQFFCDPEGTGVDPEDMPRPEVRIDPKSDQAQALISPLVVETMRLDQSMREVSALLQIGAGIAGAFSIDDDEECTHCGCYDGGFGECCECGAKNTSDPSVQ